MSDEVTTGGVTIERWRQDITERVNGHSEWIGHHMVTAEQRREPHDDGPIVTLQKECKWLEGKNKELARLYAEAVGRCKRLEEENEVLVIELKRLGERIDVLEKGE